MTHSEKRIKPWYVNPRWLDTMLIVILASCFAIGSLGIYLSIANGLKQPNDTVAEEATRHDRT